MKSTVFATIFTGGALVAALSLGCGSAPPEQPKVQEPAKTAEQTPPPAPPAGEVFTSGDYSVTLPVGLQAGAAYVPDSNPLSQAKIDLGRKLYFDTRLSKDNTISCATCHDPDKGFAETSAVSTGFHKQKGARNSPTVMNRLFSKEQFWDGRAADLEAQALGPIENPIEMGNTLQGMVSSLKAIQAYAPEFEKAFGSPEITAEKVGMAIASYERTVLAGNSPYDRYQAGDKTAMNESAVRGLAIFNDANRGNCAACHTGSNLTDESYHNLGVGMDKPKPDLGRYAITKKDADRGAFKTPTLRNIAQTAPYLHDGSEPTLAKVVDFYVKGGVPNKYLSDKMKPLTLSDQDKTDLVAFMEALTGDVTGKEKPTLP